MYWLLYDIPSNRRRNKMAQLCKDFGLNRVQKSCFFGRLEKERMCTFKIQMERLLKPEDQVCLIPISEGEAFDIKAWGDSGTLKQSLEPEAICFI